MSFTIGYGLHLIRMNGEALHQRFVACMRLLEPRHKAERAIKLCWIKLDHVRICRERACRLSSEASMAMHRLRRAHSRLLQAKVLSASVLEQSMSRLAAAKPRGSARKKAVSNTGWELARSARGE